MVDDQPFKTVENLEFQRLIKLCNGQADIPIADTIKNDIMKEFYEKKVQIADFLQVVKVSKSYTLL